MTDPLPARNWFDTGGGDYARFRPDYPPELAAHLAALAPARDCAVDVGCGSGQLARQLAGHFAQVIGLDPSAGQLARAPAHPRLRWLVARAEALPLPPRSVSLIAAAQAAHWFDLPAFHAEVRRVAVPGAIVALVSYGVLRLDDAALQARFARFYAEEIGPFWPPERRLVDGGYAGMAFPFAELPAPAMQITREWSLAAFLGYLSTWSAVRHAREAGQAAVLAGFAADLAALWGDPAARQVVTWPLAMRLGRAASDKADHPPGAENGEP